LLTVREFYSLLRAAIKGAKGIGRIGLLINDQTIPKIMGKMPYTDWREWATRRPDWLQQDVTTAFEGFVKRKWQDALNVAAAEPASWQGDGEKANSGAHPPDRTAGTSKGALKITGAVNVVEQGISSRSHSPSWDVSFGRKCRARNLIGCDGDHLMLQCRKMKGLGLSERREVLEKSGLCMFCLKHAAELECYGRGGMSKPRCTQSGFDGEHTPSVHKLMAEEHAGVNLIAEDEDDDEDEDRDEDKGWWVATVGAMEVPNREEGILSEIDESEPEYPPVDCFPDGVAEDRRWSPGPIQPYPVGGGGQEPSAPRRGGSPTTNRQLPQLGPPWGNCLASRAPSGGS
jgi:hypothetical protein